MTLEEFLSFITLFIPPKVYTTSELKSLYNSVEEKTRENLIVALFGYISQTDPTLRIVEKNEI